MDGAARALKIRRVYYEKSSELSEPRVDNNTHSTKSDKKF